MVDQQFEDLCAVDCQGCRFIVRRCDCRPPNISFGAFIDYAVGCRLAHGADRPGRLICEFTSLSDLLRQCSSFEEQEGDGVVFREEHALLLVIVPILLAFERALQAAEAALQLLDDL